MIVGIYITAASRQTLTPAQSPGKLAALKPPASASTSGEIELRTEERAPEDLRPIKITPDFIPTRGGQCAD